MYGAYKFLPVLERLPLPIECIACYETSSSGQDFASNVSNTQIISTSVYLLVGTKPGHLLVYKVQRENSPHLEVTLEKSHRSFSKRPIQQLFVCSELKILISLSDGLVSVHDLITFQLITVLSKAKGAVLFAGDLEEQTSSTGDVAYALKLCVVVKRKLQFYFWKKRDFIELHVKTLYNDFYCLGIPTSSQKYGLFCIQTNKLSLGNNMLWSGEHVKGNRNFEKSSSWCQQFIGSSLKRLTTNSADVAVPEVPKCLSWCRDTLCLGLKREYMLVKLTENEPLRELFPTGKSMEPVVSQLDSNQLIVMKDDVSIFIDYNGSPTYKQCFQWSGNPVFVESQPPFLVAILPKHIEIQTLEPKLLIQKVDCFRAKLLSSYNNWMFVSSTSHIWLLQQNPISEQVDQLIRNRQFALALKLAKMSNEQNENVKMMQIRQIRTSLAFELFCQRKFEDSLRIFSDLQTDIVQVIGLFPDLLPPYYQKKFTYPSTLPAITGTDLEQALHALIELLTDKRNKTSTYPDSILENTYPIMEGNSVVSLKRTVLQIIDTTLLKCYLKTNNALVAHLLRLPDNHCHADEAERVLLAAGKHRELIELYKNKGLHRKALDLLKKQSNRNESREDMIEYLQHMGSEHLDVIFNYSPHLLRSDPTSAIKIFIGDTAEVESLPKKQVFDFLDAFSSNLVMAYLEHIIKTLRDETSEFHNRLAVLYRDKVVALMKEYLDSLPEGDKINFNNAPLDLTEAREKLTKFLEESSFYEAERILEDFPDDSLVEERAILLGRMGRYHQALALYTFTLKDPDRAEQFCRKVYEQNPAANSEVFFCLLKMYLDPHHNETVASTFSVPNPASRLDIEPAIQLLDRHSTKIDPEKALALLPASLKISRLQDYLKRILERFTKRLHNAQVLESLLLSESQQVHERRIMHESHKCTITEEIVCKICKKRIGVSAFARYPNDVVVHYYCYKDRKTTATPLPIT